jgi:hypothetical protein
MEEEEENEEEEEDDGEKDLQLLNLEGVVKATYIRLITIKNDTFDK